VHVCVLVCVREYEQVWLEECLYTFVFARAAGGSEYHSVYLHDGEGTFAGNTRLLK